MEYIVTSLRENPELALFLTLALGFLIGRVRIGSFSLGNVVGTLLAGVLVGQLDIKVAPIVKIVFFDLFLFATGYKVGPQFFRGLKKNALSQVSLTVVLCVTSLVTTVAAAKVLEYECGTAAGLMAGAFTESTVIGTAGDTINRLDIPEAEKQRLLNQIPVAYAVSYLVGTGFVVWFLANLAPKLLKVNLKAESRRLESEMSGGPNSDSSGHRRTGNGTCAPSAWRTTAARAAAWAISRRLTLPTGCSSSEFAGATRSSFRNPRRSFARETSWRWRRAGASCSPGARRSAPRSTTRNCSISRQSPSTSCSPTRAWPTRRSKRWPSSTGAAWS